ncbi:MAG TPA: inositol monophosphatase family protein [Casimicrobiaceae bacterium]|nr:inositol monophosphatase family protein [Casimicrobiaceae bacterium]
MTPMLTGDSKIFGIGLSKTGTTSLANALQLLGYRTRDNIGVATYVAGDIASVDLDAVARHDALTDTPIPSFYRELDARYPASKFILTVRDREAWLASCRKQFTARHATEQNEAHRRLFRDLYGTEVFDEQRFAEGYRRFVDGVHEHFSGRPSDLLVLDVSGGEGWEKLCAFLGRPIPAMPFPKANVTRIRWMSIEDVVAVAVRGGAELLRQFALPQGVDPASGRTAKGRSSAASRVLDATFRALRGESAGEMAARRAHAAVIEGLHRLNPAIPVVSRLSEPIGYSIRKGWNHLWLVDPLDGESAFALGGSAFSIDIALIEDGRPIYGIVHAPALETTYYARAGKNALRVTAGRESTLGKKSGEAGDAEHRLRESSASGRRSDGSSRALALCALAQSQGSPRLVLPSSSEWEIAAAHAIVSAAGLSVCDEVSGAELDYNKADLANGPLRVG